MKTFCTFVALIISLAAFSQSGTIQGVISDEKSPVENVSVTILENKLTTLTDSQGKYSFTNIAYGNYTLEFSIMGFTTKRMAVNVNQPQTTANTTLYIDQKQLSEVEVFGVRNKAPEKLHNLTRLPLKPTEQIQSISVISEKVIEQQGALTITEATRNVPGVYAFASYGNKRESMGSRGYRGIPILKNGVRVNSDFRGIGILTDASGIDNIQVLKGVAAITQGVATDIGSAGGVINIVTKTPKFESGGNVSMRAGSWGLARPQFDVYGPMDDNKNIAFRINGAYQTNDSYRSLTSGDRIYVNPSLAWKADDKTTITLEMDYLDDSRTPDLGTINLAPNDTYAIYDLPNEQFLGFKSDRVTAQNATYAIRLDRKLNDIFTVKAAYFKSDLYVDDRGASLVTHNSLAPSQRYRRYSTSTRKDINEVLQLDLVAQDLMTGSIKHTFQAGVDYNRNKTATSSASSGNIDIIDVYAPIANILPTDVTVGTPTLAGASTKGMGVLAQGVTTWTNWLKTFVGVRYSSVETLEQGALGVQKNDAWNPLGGIMISPTKNINIFASYTNSSNPRTASRLDINGSELGNERWDQIETGFKTFWVNDRLRFNVTLFKINNTDMNLPVYNAAWEETGYYQKGGNDQRQGVEVELSGRILENLEVITGYSYIDARYKDHTAYVYNSSPLNTPKHTVNAWVNYSFKNTVLKGLSIGAGAYHLGSRPMNDWAHTPTHAGMVAGQKPFDLKAYTIVNLQAGYAINANWDVRVLANNIFDELGYNAYRTSNINQIDPINFSGVLTYRF